MTRVFTSAVEAYEEIKRTLSEMGTKVAVETMQDKNVEGEEGYRTLELRGYDFKIMDTSTRRQLVKHLKLNEEYITMEFSERVCASQYLNPGDAWKSRREVWEQFLEKNDRFSYTYNQRMRPFYQHVLEELKMHPHSRQGIIPLFWQQDVYAIGGIRRVPCSMFYQFVRRDGQLEMYYVMRSCDFITHFPYDIILAMEIQNHAAQYLGEKPGVFHMYIISLHAYRKDIGDAF